MSVEAVESGVVEEGSLAEHESSFGPNAGREPEPEAKPVEVEASQLTDETPEAKEERERDEKGQFARGRHRAEKDKARPEDVPRIREMSRQNGELARQLAEANRALEEIRRSRQPETQPKPTPQATPSATFTEKAPKLEDFSREEDPYGSWLLAMGRFERKQERFEAEQAAKAARETSERESLEREANETQQKAISEYSERLAEFKESHTDFDDVVRGAIDTVGDLQVPPLAQATMLLHDKGPEMLYYLCRNSDAMDDFLLLTDGKAITDGNVALATRFLERRLNAAATGSATPTPQRRKPPTPPNPVRTVPSQDRAHDDEDSSLQDHERKYGRQRR